MRFMFSVKFQSVPVEGFVFARWWIFLTSQARVLAFKMLFLQYNTIIKSASLELDTAGIGSFFILSGCSNHKYIMLSIPGHLLLSPYPSHSHLMSRKYRRKLKMSPFKNLIISSTPRFSLIVESSWKKDESFSWHEVYSMQDSTEPGQSGHVHILSDSKKHYLEDNSYKFIVF